MFGFQRDTYSCKLGRLERFYSVSLPWRVRRTTIKSSSSVLVARAVRPCLDGDRGAHDPPRVIWKPDNGRHRGNHVSDLMNPSGHQTAVIWMDVHVSRFIQLPGKPRSFEAADQTFHETGTNRRLASLVGFFLPQRNTHLVLRHLRSFIFSCVHPIVV